mgnify:CR=1 FL=1
MLDKLIKKWYNIYVFDIIVIEGILVIKMKKIINSLSKNIDYISQEENEGIITITAVSNQKRARCPYCGEYSGSVNTRYYREIQDLPYEGKTVIIKIRHKIYDCQNDKCNQTRFGEPYDFVESKGNKTNRLNEYILKETQGLSVRKAEKKLRDEGIKISRNTINIKRNEA